MNDKTTDVHPLAQRLNDEMLEALDEELELELDDDRLDAAVEHITGRQPKPDLTIDRDTYLAENSVAVAAGTADARVAGLGCTSKTQNW